MEEWMQNLTPSQIVAVLAGLLLAASAAINQVGSAVEKIAKAWRAAKAPNDEQNDRLDDLEKIVAEHERKLNSDKRQLDEINDGLRAIYMADLALLDHCLNGNNIDNMEAAKKGLQKHLINH